MSPGNKVLLINLKLVAPLLVNVPKEIKQTLHPKLPLYPQVSPLQKMFRWTQTL